MKTGIATEQELLDIIRTFAHTHGTTLAATLRALQERMQHEREAPPMPNLPPHARLVQVGDTRAVHVAEAVTPESDARLASDIVVEQRNQ